MKNKEHSKDLFSKYLDGTYSEEELDTLLRYFELSEHTEELKSRINEELESTYNFEGYTEGINEVDLFVRDALFRRTQAIPQRKIPYLKIAVAVAASLLLVFSINHYWSKRALDEGILVQENAIDILPGRNKATLQFDNGEAIVLREDRDGIQTEAGQITYNDGTEVVSAIETQYATLTVPRAGQYQATLPDGTRVWLNAETVLRYPTNFSGATREVEIEGEAYFEVVHNPNQPFVVKSNKQSVQVLGTSFNINTVLSSTVTTLVEGSVELLDNNQFLTKLVPGQQAVTSTTGYVVKKVNVENYIAWKEGVIVLNKQNIQDILNQLERWYDVEFVNGSSIDSQVELSGEIPRDINLSGILQALEEQLKINFKMKGRRIIINQ